MPQIETRYQHEDEKTSMKDILGMGTLVLVSMGDDLYSFLATHPIPVGTRNLISVFLGEGGTIGLDSRSNIVEAIEDCLQL